MDRTPRRNAGAAGGAARRRYAGRLTGKEDESGGACASWKTASLPTTCRPRWPACEPRWSARRSRDASTVARDSGWRRRSRESLRPSRIAVDPDVPEEEPAMGTGVPSRRTGAAARAIRVRPGVACAEDSCWPRTRFALANANPRTRTETRADRCRRTAGAYPPAASSNTRAPAEPPQRRVPMRAGSPARCPDERQGARMMGSPRAQLAGAQHSARGSAAIPIRPSSARTTTRVSSQRYSISTS